MDENNHTNIKEKIIEIKDGLPRRQKNLCDFILKNFTGLGLVTIKELSEQAEVGISTVMRTIKALGYDNFNDFRKDIYEEAMPDESKWTLKVSIDESSEDTHTPIKVWRESVDLLNSSLTENFIDDFTVAMDYINDAEYINIMGSRPYKAAAMYFNQVLGEFHSHVRLLDNDAETLFDKILQFKQHELLIVFAFEPYTNLIINAVREIKKRGADIILITDYDSCPIISYADVVLKLSVSKNHFTILPIIALIDAMVLEAGKHTTADSLERLKLLEKTLKDNNILYDS